MKDNYIEVTDQYNNKLILDKINVLNKIKQDKKQYRGCRSFKCTTEEFDREISVIEKLIKNFTEEDLKVFLNYVPKDENGSIRSKYYPLYSTGIYEDDHWDNCISPYDLVIMPVLYLDRKNERIIEAKNEFKITMMLTSYSISNTNAIIHKDLSYHKLEDF